MEQPIDHISKALERAQSEKRSVRDWVRPTRSDGPVADSDIEPKKATLLSPVHLHARHILSGRGKEDPAFSDRYRLLRTRVIQALKTRGHSVVGITSPGPKDGKTLTSINLAISIAREGSYKVVLIDADLRKPSVADDLGIRAAAGLIDHLSSDVEFEDVILRTNVENLFVVPGRHEESHVAVPELLSSDKMRQLIEQLRRREKCIVVVDLPPVRLGDDVVALAPYLDGILLIVREGETTVDALRDSAELLKDFTILGTVLNQSSDKKLKFEGYYYHGTPERS